MRGSQKSDLNVINVMENVASDYKLYNSIYVCFNFEFFKLQLCLVKEKYLNVSRIQSLKSAF